MVRDRPVSDPEITFLTLQCPGHAHFKLPPEKPFCFLPPNSGALCELLDAKPLLVAEAGVHHEVHADPWRAGRVGRDIR